MSLDDVDDYKNNDLILSCGHTPVVFESISKPMALRFKLGGVRVVEPRWRATCEACASKSMSPRMVWFGRLGDVRAGNFKADGILF